MVVPSGIGAPGRPGFWSGSKASLRFCGLACPGLVPDGLAPEGVAGRPPLASCRRKLHVLLELAQLLAQLAVLMLERLDLAGLLAGLVPPGGSGAPRTPTRLAPPPDASPASWDRRRGRGRRSRGAGGGAWRSGPMVGGRSGAAYQRRPSTAKGSHRRPESSEPAPRSRTVTARRFCDQQEISLHTATGRSLP